MIPQPGGFFKTESVSGLVHLPGEAVYQLPTFTFKQQQGIFQLVLIVFGIDRQGTGTEAALDLIFQARPGAVTKDGVGTGPQGKDSANDFQGLLDCRAGVERSQIFTAVLRNLAGQEEAWPLVMLGDLYVPIGGIVLEPNIIPRPELLNQGVFEQQRLFFGLGNNDLDIGQLGEEKTDLRAAVPAAGVLSDPGTQIVRFPDVEHGAGVIRELIDAGTGWQSCQLGFEFGVPGERVNVSGFFVWLEDRFTL